MAIAIHISPYASDVISSMNQTCRLVAVVPGYIENAMYAIIRFHYFFFLQLIFFVRYYIFLYIFIYFCTYIYMYKFN